MKRVERQKEQRERSSSVRGVATGEGLQHEKITHSSSMRVAT
jgi:hypothetical protein